jgi:hypothetical protein
MSITRVKLAMLLMPCICMIVCSFVVGCTRSIAHDSRYPTDYAVGQVYRLKQPLFAEKADSTIFGTYSELIFFVGQQNMSGIPPTLEAYNKSRADWPEIAGVALPGTRIKISKIVYRTNWEAGDGIWVKAQILDGALAGKKLAEMYFVSREVDRRSDLSVFIPMVDTNILESVP